MRSGWLRGSIYRVLLFRDRFLVSKPLSQIQWSALLLLQEAFHTRQFGGLGFRLHRPDLPGKPDLVLSRHKAIIFVNGCFWHWHPSQDCPIAGLPKSNLNYWQPKLERTRLRDEQHTYSLQTANWRVLVIWECELRHPGDVLLRICEVLENSSMVTV